jgi:hypothetical protein
MIVRLPPSHQTDTIVQHRVFCRDTVHGFSILHSCALLFGDVAFHLSKAVEEYTAETLVELLFVHAYSS